MRRWARTMPAPADINTSVIRARSPAVGIAIIIKAAALLNIWRLIGLARWWPQYDIYSGLNDSSAFLAHASGRSVRSVPPPRRRKTLRNIKRKRAGSFSNMPAADG